MKELSTEKRRAWDLFTRKHEDYEGSATKGYKVNKVKSVRSGVDKTYSRALTQVQEKTRIY